MAGVGNSNNLYVWNKLLDPQAGMLRLVFGLGTRAVDRDEGDYPRIVALDYPLLSTQDSKTAEKTYSQHYVDVIDLDSNQLSTISLDQLVREQDNLDLSDVGEIDWEATRQLAELGLRNRQQWILNFKKTLADKVFVETMRTLLKFWKRPAIIPLTLNLRSIRPRKSKDRSICYSADPSRPNKSALALLFR